MNDKTVVEAALPALTCHRVSHAEPRIAAAVHALAEVLLPYARRQCSSVYPMRSRSRCEPIEAADCGRHVCISVFRAQAGVEGGQYGFGTDPRTDRATPEISAGIPTADVAGGVSALPGCARILSVSFADTDLGPG